MWRKAYAVDKINNINQLYDFAKIGEVIPPTEALRKPLKQTLF